MIDGTDLSTLRTSVRDLIGEETARLWLDTRIDRDINAEFARLSRKVIALDVGYFEAQKTYTAAATLTLPINAYIIRSIEALIDNVYVTVPWIRPHQQTQNQTLGTTPSVPLSVRFESNTLSIVGYNAASSYRVTYARIPAGLRSETVASRVSATEFTLSAGSYFDDVYVGDTVVVTSGTGLGEWHPITDYVASTKTYTTATWTATLDTTSVVSWLLPEPLDKWSDLVVTGAAIRLLGRRRDTEMANHLLATYAADMEDMTNALTQRQTDSMPMHGNYLPDGEE